MEIIAVYAGHHKKHTTKWSTLCRQNTQLLIVKAVSGTCKLPKHFTVLTHWLWIPMFANGNEQRGAFLSKVATRVIRHVLINSINYGLITFCRCSKGGGICRYTIPEFLFCF
jgi:hypothetical protein